jgi:hypothetical protein
VALSRANDATPHDSWVSLLNLIFKRFYKNKKLITKAPRHQGKPCFSGHANGCWSGDQGRHARGILAGIQALWIPAFAGMTIVDILRAERQGSVFWR